MDSLIKSRFGRLTVLRKLPKTIESSDIRYECYCDCGNITKVEKSSLVSGQTKSCGCLAIELHKGRMKIPEKDFPKIVYLYISTDKTLDEIGKEYGVTRERIRQIISMFGDVHKLPKPKISKEDKDKFRENKRIRDFWSKVSVGEDDECWEWQGYKRSITGYGAANRKLESSAHRASYKLTYGSIPDGMWVLHKCDNPPCCNPNHLYLGDAKDNAVDRETRNRYMLPRGKNGQKISIVKMRNMFCDYVMGSTLDDISNKYKVSKTGSHKRIIKFSRTNDVTKFIYNKFKSGILATQMDIELIPEIPDVSLPRIPYRKESSWKKYSKILAERDGGYFCYYCHVPLIGKNESDGKTWGTIDHVYPRIHGGSHNVDNMVLSCNYCNAKKGHSIPKLEDYTSHYPSHVGNNLIPLKIVRV